MSLAVAHLDQLQRGQIMVVIGGTTDIMRRFWQKASVEINPTETSSAPLVRGPS